jgi:hypothetical protein
VKENSIEEAIERLEYIDRQYSCNNYYSIWDLECIALLLSDYKRVLKENEKLKADRDKFKKALAKRITYCNELEKDLFENCSNYIVSKQKIKDKIEEIQEDKTSKYYDMFLEERDLEYTIKILQALLESEE